MVNSLNKEPAQSEDVVATILVSASDPNWAKVAAENLYLTLTDHAHCEKKAAASAISLISTYPEDGVLVKAMAALASEEMGHFREVYDMLLQKEWTLERDEGDPYVKRLLSLVRQPPVQRKLDRLLISSLIEARSCERFHLLADEFESLGEQRQCQTFRRLAHSEAGHATLFLTLARRDDPSVADERLKELAAKEAEIVAELPLLPRIH